MNQYEYERDLKLLSAQLAEKSRANARMEAALEEIAKPNVHTESDTGATIEECDHCGMEVWYCSQEEDYTCSGRVARRALAPSDPAPEGGAPTPTRDTRCSRCGGVLKICERCNGQLAWRCNRKVGEWWEHYPQNTAHEPKPIDCPDCAGGKL